MSSDPRPHPAAGPAVVCIQSREVSPAILAQYVGAEYLPERGVSAAIVRAARDPAASLLCVTAPELADERRQLDYFIDLAVTDPARRDDARRRIEVASLRDASRRWLSTKVLADTPEAGALRARLAGFARRAAAEGRPAVLNSFEPSADLEALSAELGLAVDQAPADSIPLGTKSAGRALFTEVGVPVPPGTGVVHSAGELARAVVPLVGRGIRSFVLKLDDTRRAGGYGNALVHLDRLPPTGDGDEVARAVLDGLAATAPLDPRLDWVGFQAELARTGALAEELLAGDRLHSPSFQGVLSGAGPRVVATHEQTLVDGQSYVGSRFPADDAYRDRVTELGLRVGRALHERGLHRGEYGVDFVAVLRNGSWALHGCEVNLRSTGVKHGFSLVTTLLDTVPDVDGRLVVDGEPRVYVATDSIVSADYAGLRAGDVLDAVEASGASYDPGRRRGVVLFTISSIPAYGKLGAVAVDRDHDRCEALLDELRAVLDGLAARRPAPALGTAR